jgi:hypothetical protein
VQYCSAARPFPIYIGEIIAQQTRRAMQFLSADAVFLTVAGTGVIFLLEIGIFILAGMI